MKRVRILVVPASLHDKAEAATISIGGHNKTPDGTVYIPLIDPMMVDKGQRFANQYPGATIR